MNDTGQEPEAPVTHGDLPLPNYDHLPLGSLQHRIRTLDEPGLTTLRDYERAHGARTPVLQVLEQRLTELREGAEPSGGSPRGEQPEAPGPSRGGSPVSPATEGPRPDASPDPRNI